MKILEILENLNAQFDYGKSSDFFSDGLLDSFNLTRLIVAMEEAYGIELNGDDLNAENFKNITALENLLSRHGVEQDS